ncbi:MAG: hypothetical protein K1W17_02045 [Oscillospiraceae bacterium]
MDLKKFLDFIPYGKSNSLSMRELSVRSGNDLRTTRKLVEAARKEGVPLCSDCGKNGGGYYFPINVSEALPCRQQMKARLSSCTQSLNAIERYIKENGGGEDE